MKQYLFAYGTLVPEHAPEEIRDNLRSLMRIGQGFIEGVLYDLGEYPGAIFDPDAPTTVCGEVFEIPSDPKFLARLDAYEDFDPAHPEESLFRRERRVAFGSFGPGPHFIECWVYAYNRDPRDAPIVEAGDYARSRASRQRA